ncbi:MAG: P-type conjugative transfer protein VirB9, partial [Pseudomonas sp.]
MKRTSLTLVLLASLVGAVYAADMPQGSRYDSRIQYVQYNPGDVVIVRSLPGMGTRIVFGVGEEVIDVASGFTQGWEFLASDNILYFKPKSVRMGGSGQEGRT